jgi:hypothetical protein
MDQLISRGGHTVFLRQPDSARRWEAACDCGYRSTRTVDLETAEQAGLVHAEQAPEVKKATRKKAVPKKKRKGKK